MWNWCSIKLLIVFACALPGMGHGQGVYGKRIFRSSADSVQYEALRKQVLDNLRLDIRSDNDAIHKKGEKLLVKSIPAYQMGVYAFFDDLMRTDRPDTITHLGLYLLEGRSLPAKIRACVNLKELDISGCHIEKLPGWLSELSQLEVLAVSKSNLKRLKLNNVNLPSLKTVNLAYNELRRVPRGLSVFDSLEELNLSGNRIKTLRRSLGQYPALAYLNLGYNRIRRSKIKSNTHLKSINLSHNGMKNMPFSLSGFERLISLNLSYNAITDIQKDIGGKELRVVNLYNNRLDHIPDKIIELKGLRDLDLSHNQIIEVSPGIEQMTALNALSLWDNEVTRLPDELSRLPHLGTLYLQDNQLFTLSDSLAKLPLVKLDVGYNRLTSVPQWVFRSSTIEELFVNNNDIGEIGRDVLMMPKLKVLYIFGNPISDRPDLTRTVDALRRKNVDVRQ